MNTNLMRKCLSSFQLGLKPTKIHYNPLLRPVLGFKTASMFCSNRNNDNEDPDDKKKKNQDWKERYQQRIREFNDYCDFVYRKRWSSRTITGVGLALLFLYAVISEKRDH